MPPDDGTTNPKTLKTPSLVDDAVGSLSPKDYVRSQEDLYNNYLAGLSRSKKDFKVEAGQVLVKDDSAKAEAESLANSRYPNDPVRRQAFIDSFDTDSEYVVDSLGSEYLNSLNSAKLEFTRAAEDEAERKKLLGGVKSYYDTEEDKTSEITRQFKDFEDRASLLYDLMDDEQQYGMNADDQNIQNWKAQEDLGMAINPGGFHAKPYMQGSLSSILGPSLPGYVRPDYRLNSAVGLPGPEGFDDPDYNQYGMPAYASGTDPNRPRKPWPWRKE
jgi:hypothetical protein